MFVLSGIYAVRSDLFIPTAFFPQFQRPCERRYQQTGDSGSHDASYGSII